MLHTIILSLASNYQQNYNLSEARRRLEQLIHVWRYTESLWTEPIHSPLPNLYLNQLLFGATSLSVNQLNESLKQMETEMGRTPEERHQGIVRIDLDLLQYDSKRYHLADWERPYVKKLL